MTKIRVFPHEELCPEGKEIDAESGEILAEVLLQNQIKIEHACELSCACTTCHVIVRKGFESLGEASDDEEDMFCLLYTSPSPRDATLSRMPSSA